MSTERKVGGGRNDEFKRAEAYKEFAVELQQDELPAKLEKSDIRPRPGDTGETEIVLQRHGAYVRDREDELVGSLSPESAQTEKEAAREFFRNFFSQLSEEERTTVDILFVSSDTQYFEGGRRSLETAILAQEAAREVLADFQLSPDAIINSRDQEDGEGGPRTIPKLREPNFLNDSPDFLDYMLNKYGGINLDFWIAFEEDQEKETRLAMGAEGPDDIADRTAFTVRVLARYARVYHKTNPDRRLIIWGATHYDTISPFVKREIFGVGKEQQLMVNYGAGLSIDIDREGKGTTELGGKTYEVPVSRN